eukprot:3536104-Prymnesium_polylepis.1
MRRDERHDAVGYLGRRPFAFRREARHPVVDVLADSPTLEELYSIWEGTVVLGRDAAGTEART